MEGICLESDITTDFPELQREPETDTKKPKLIEPVKNVILKRERGQKLASKPPASTKTSVSATQHERSELGLFRYFEKIDRFVLKNLTKFLDAIYDAVMPKTAER